MNDRTLIKLASDDKYISVRTISKARKSPHRFYFSRDELANLEDRQTVISKDIASFATLYVDPTDRLIMNFTWLQIGGDSESVSGYRETVAVPYNAFKAFLADPEMAPWTVLSVYGTETLPRITFTDNAHATLRRVLKHPALRNKLSRAFRDNFQWRDADEIRLDTDWDEYSFFFTEKRKGGSRGICGGLILHPGMDRSNLRQAVYSVHT